MENKEQNNSLRELNTPFGKFYIEPWEWHKDNKYPYTRSDRITIYDSRKDWLDYFSVDYFEEGNNTLEEEYEAFKQFLDWLGIDYDYAGKSKKQAAMALSDGHPNELLPDELETNEYINHIGDNYIVVSDR